MRNHYALSAAQGPSPSKERNQKPMSIAQRLAKPNPTSPKAPNHPNFTKMKKSITAIKIFAEGNNCAQSVLLSYADDLKLDKDTAESITSGFGAGMGRLHKTCGALTGSFMVIGRAQSITENDSQEKSDKTNSMIQQLESDFTNEFETSNCASLIKTDLKTEEGREYFNENNLKENVCNKCVGFCVDWLEENLS